MSSTTFFSQLGNEKENQLSRTFATCFNTSAVFRHQILLLLHDICQPPAPKVPEGAWRCKTEEQTPTAGGGRLDLVISAESARKAPKAFVIENKVEAKLTLKQLRKYKEHDVEYLIAVTKYPPDVPGRQLKEEGVFALRWQDVHRHLSSQLPRTPVDRFLIKRFIEYLEDLKMAYPEQLKASDLKDLRRVLNVASSDRRWKGLDPKKAFATADQCLQVLAELRRQLVEKIPELGEFEFWGPKFYVWRPPKDDDVKSGFHAFGWQIRSKPHRDPCFSCSFEFPRSQRKLSWDVSLYWKDRPEKEKLLTLSHFSDADGLVRQEWLSKKLIEAAKRWRVAKIIRESSRRRRR